MDTKQATRLYVKSMDTRYCLRVYSDALNAMMPHFRLHAVLLQVPLILHSIVVLIVFRFLGDVECLFLSYFLVSMTSTPYAYRPRGSLQRRG